MSATQSVLVLLMCNGSGFKDEDTTDSTDRQHNNSKDNTEELEHKKLSLLFGHQRSGDKDSVCKPGSQEALIDMEGGDL